MCETGPARNQDSVLKRGVIHGIQQLRLGMLPGPALNFLDLALRPREPGRARYRGEPEGLQGYGRVGKVSKVSLGVHS